MNILISLSLCLLFSASEKQLDILRELYEEGRFREAQQKLKEIAPSSSHAAEILLYKGLLAQDARKSITHFQSIIKDYPQSKHRIRALFLLSQYHFLKKSYKKAIAAFKQIVKSETETPYSGQTCIWIALSYEALNDTTRSMAWYMKVNSADSISYTIAHKALSNLKELKSIYSIQIGSFQNKESASSLTETYSDKGYRTWLAITKQKGIKYYKVLIGEFDNKEKARGFSKLFKQKEDIQFWIVKIRKLK
ncbi:MAG: tetratricopeptide repeat protein [Candidatus Cloacimonadota bacterium]|nr:MAG: tetratricopeptide repeat protein [Candidatus Cloacimonadota bacterium]